MTLAANAFFRLANLLGFKPCDSGAPPPELIEVIEGARRLTIGGALDLGCGTGATSVYMASKGWDVNGPDFVPGAIRTARRKAAGAGVRVAFLVGHPVGRPRLSPDEVRARFTVFELMEAHARTESLRIALVNAASPLMRFERV